MEINNGNIRLSASDIETYRYYILNEEATLEDCLASLRRERPATPAMEAGKALHGILEDAVHGGEAFYRAERDGFRFSFKCDIALDVSPVRELKGEMEIPIAGGVATLVGVVDAIDTSVTDYKLTGRFDAERFADSYQWRCYLHMFGASRFVYRVFVGREVGDHDWVISEYHELPVYRYPGMKQDVVRKIEEFAAFARKYLTVARAA